eukprot:m.327806 g.327806  ORF g.327806 m.327806 type:complete len:366 (-) comp55584_c0_seq2:1225-2322(-)
MRTVAAVVRKLLLEACAHGVRRGPGLRAQKLVDDWVHWYRKVGLVAERVRKAILDVLPQREGRILLLGQRPHVWGIRDLERGNLPAMLSAHTVGEREQDQVLERGNQARPIRERREVVPVDAKEYGVVFGPHNQRPHHAEINTQRPKQRIVEGIQGGEKEGHCVLLRPGLHKSAADDTEVFRRLARLLNVRAGMENLPLAVAEKGLGICVGEAGDAAQAAVEALLAGRVEGALQLLPVLPHQSNHKRQLQDHVQAIPDKRVDRENVCRVLDVWPGREAVRSPDEQEEKAEKQHNSKHQHVAAGRACKEQECSHLVKRARRWQNLNHGDAAWALQQELSTHQGVSVVGRTEGAAGGRQRRVRCMWK